MWGSRNFRQGGPGPSEIKKSSDKVFLVLLFYRSPMVTFKENYHFPRFQRQSNISLWGGGPTSSRRVQLLIPYRNLYNLCFTKGGGGCPDPLSPLWICPWMWIQCTCISSTVDIGIESYRSGSTSVGAVSLVPPICIQLLLHCFLGNVHKCAHSVSFPLFSGSSGGSVSNKHI